MMNGETEMISRDNAKGYGDLLAIDENKLEKEWVLQPKMYFDVAAELVDARSELDRAKANLDLVDADLDKEIRLTPSEFGLEKVTETAIKSVVLGHAKHAEANERYLSAKHDVGILQAAAEALDHRKKALESLVTLWTHNYYAEPKAPKGSEEFARDARKQDGRRALPKSERKGK